MALSATEILEDLPELLALVKKGSEVLAADGSIAGGGGGRAVEHRDLVLLHQHRDAAAQLVRNLA